jgi:hypothetical protein
MDTGDERISTKYPQMKNEIPPHIPQNSRASIVPLRTIVEQE